MPVCLYRVTRLSVCKEWHVCMYSVKRLCVCTEWHVCMSVKSYTCEVKINTDGCKMSDEFRFVLTCRLRCRALQDQLHAIGRVCRMPYLFLKFLTCMKEMTGCCLPIFFLMLCPSLQERKVFIYSMCPAHSLPTIKASEPERCINYTVVDRLHQLRLNHDWHPCKKVQCSHNCELDSKYVIYLTTGIILDRRQVKMKC